MVVRVGLGERFGGCLGHAGVGETLRYTAATSSRRPKCIGGVALRGFDDPGETATNPGIFVSCLGQATQKPKHASEPDAMRQFVASLNPDQRVQLATLLLADPGCTAGPPGDAE